MVRTFNFFIFGEHLYGIKRIAGGFVSELQVIDYYNKKGVVAKLLAEKPPKEVTVEVQKVLSS